MQQTTNYKFKKPELTDSPPDITVLNGNFDIIDEKLFAVIKAWEDFKANGGEVGGIVTFNSSLNNSLKINGRTIEAIGNSLKLKGKDTQEVLLAYEEGTTRLRPSASGCELGASTTRFKDIWLNDYIRSANGYTKLPNGFILQWGSWSLPSKPSISTYYGITFPISFSNKALQVVITPTGIDANSNAVNIASRVSLLTNAKMDIRLNPDSTATSCTVNYFVIGY